MSWSDLGFFDSFDGSNLVGARKRGHPRLCTNSRVKARDRGGAGIALGLSPTTFTFTHTTSYHHDVNRRRTNDLDRRRPVTLIIFNMDLTSHQTEKTEDGRPGLVCVCFWNIIGSKPRKQPRQDTIDLGLAADRTLNKHKLTDCLIFQDD